MYAAVHAFPSSVHKGRRLSHLDETPGEEAGGDLGAPSLEGLLGVGVEGGRVSDEAGEGEADGEQRHAQADQQWAAVDQVPVPGDFTAP